MYMYMTICEQNPLTILKSLIINVHAHSNALMNKINQLNTTKLHFYNKFAKTEHLQIKEL